MSVIQKIRDKYARWAVIAIAVSLIGFILMDAFGNRSGFGSQSTTIGKVNGKKIDYRDFQRKVQMTEDRNKQQGFDRGDAGREQVINDLWNTEISRTLMKDQVEDLGMTVTDKEMDNMLFGPENPQYVVQMFGDPSTGQYNAEGLRNYVQQVKRSNEKERQSELTEAFDAIEMARLGEKYNSLLSNSSYFPKWLIEKQNADNSQISNVSYVSVSFNTISDSAVKVTDDEIAAYIKDHEEDFEQKEETRNISYVVFDGTATRADSLAIFNELQALKPQFAAASDMQTFLTQQGNNTYNDQYVPASSLTLAAKDSFLTAPVGGVVGPYLEGTNYVLAKKVDQKVLPDSAKVRHILVQTFDPQSGRQILDDSAGKRRIDSVFTALKAGVSFDTLVQRYSDDAGSKAKGGVYDYFAQGQMVKAFNDFTFGKPVGTRDIVKTEFGYHLIEILGQKGSQSNYKVAYLPRQIVPSLETENQASAAASAFSAQATDIKSFDEQYEKTLKAKGVNKQVGANIGENDYTVAGLGTSRSFVRSIFEADKGDVVTPTKIGDDFVVAVVTAVNKEGIQSPATARAVVEPILRNKKKAEMIVKKLGKITTLEAASAAVGQPIQTADTLRFAGTNPGIGFEMKVVGAAHNPANRGKVVSEPLIGQSGVYVLRVNGTGTVPNANANVADQQKMMRMQTRQMMAYRSPVEALVNAADIKDYRSEFY
jgi:peptidyl-prolyl cis-trans isomerase D